MTSFAKLDAQLQEHAEFTGQGSDTGSAALEDPTPLIYEPPPGDPFPIDAMGPLKPATLAIKDKTQADIGNLINPSCLVVKTYLCAPGEPGHEG